MQPDYKGERKRHNAKIKGSNFFFISSDKERLEAVIQDGKQRPCSLLIKRLQNTRTLEKETLIGLTTEQNSSLDYVYLRKEKKEQKESLFAIGQLQGKIVLKIITVVCCLLCLWVKTAYIWVWLTSK